MTKKALFIVPEWKNENFVGNLRVKRYINWLTQIGYSVTVLAAGEKNERNKTQFGEIIVFPLPYHSLLNFQKKIPFLFFSKIIASLNFYLESLFLIPDRFSLLRKKILQHIKDIVSINEFELVISTSPPESAHLIAYDIAKLNSAKLIIDMRDGWLDEPLKTILQKSRKRNLKESRFESMVLKRADLIIVTSDEWKNLLCRRYSELNERIHVIYNAYPKIELRKKGSEKTNNIKLIYSGRFRGSSFRRTPDMIFDQLLSYLKNNEIELSVKLIGEFGRKDLNQLSEINSRFSKFSSQLVIKNLIPRTELFKELEFADGFLLLSASIAAIPSKLFEYLYFGKPILAFAPKNSPIKRFSEYINQIVFIDTDENYSANKTALKKFFDLCQKSQNFIPPNDFSETELKKQFYEVLNQLDQVE